MLDTLLFCLLDDKILIKAQYPFTFQIILKNSLRSLASMYKSSVYQDFQNSHDPILFAPIIFF